MISSGSLPIQARVDTGDEQVAYLITHFGDAETWSIDSQQLAMNAEGREVERVELRLGSGELHTIEFVSGESESPFDTELDAAGMHAIPQVMAIASQFSEQNPPHHPGTLARFPIPSRAYARSLAVPMAVLALDQGRRGLYAPPRIVVVSFDSLEVRGVAEYPGFDPDNWPPARLGDWPPVTMAGRSPERLQQTMARFSAVWHRLLTAWFAKDVVESSDLALDALEAQEILALLDLPNAALMYQELNPVFWKWFLRHAGAN